MIEPGHNHENDGKLRADCMACIEERTYMLILKGKSKAEAIELVASEVEASYALTENLPTRQVDRW